MQCLLYRQTKVLKGRNKTSDMWQFVVFAGTAIVKEMAMKLSQIRTSQYVCTRMYKNVHTSIQEWTHVCTL